MSYTTQADGAQALRQIDDIYALLDTLTDSIEGVQLRLDRMAIRTIGPQELDGEEDKIAGSPERREDHMSELQRKVHRLQYLAGRCSNSLSRLEDAL